MGETLVSEPVEAVTLDELGNQLAAVVDAFELEYRTEGGYVLTGWPDTGDWLGRDPQYDRLQSVDGLARACYVYRDSTSGAEAAVYFDRVDGDIEHIELVGGEFYGEAIECVRETYGMDVTEDMVW